MVFEPNNFDIFLYKVNLKINHRVNDLNNNKILPNKFLNICV